VLGNGQHAGNLEHPPELVIQSNSQSKVAAFNTYLELCQSVPQSQLPVKYTGA
jgi:hypothetical protein